MAAKLVMRLVILFPIVLLLSVVSCNDAIPEKDQLASDDSSSSISVLILTSIYPAHFFPLLALGEELIGRGHNVTMLGPTLEGYEGLPLAAEEKGLRFISAGFEPRSSYDMVRHAGKHDGDKSFLSFFYNISQQLKSRKGDTEMDRMVAKLKTMSRHEYDYIISDNAVIGVVYFIINEWKTHKIMIHFAPLPIHPVGMNPWPVPKILSGLTDDMTFKDRLINTLVYSPLEWLGLQLIEILLVTSNDTMTNEPFTTFLGVKYPVIYNTLIGFDFPRVVLPLQHYVGPMLTPYPSPLDPSVTAWLKDKPPKSVIYVSMGTSADVTPEMATAVLSLANTRYVLWSSRNDLSQYDVDEERVYVTPWVSQLAVLNHSSVAYSILQCGLTSVQESLYYGVPVVCIPSAFEQFDVSLRLIVQELGARLLPDNITKESLTEALEYVSRESIRNNVNRMRIIMRANGGVKKAADLVQLYADVGHEHAIPSFAKYDWYWYEFYNLDVYFVMIVLTVILVWVVKKLLCYLCCRCCKSKGAKTKKD